MLDKLRLKENRAYIILFVCVLIVLALYTYSSNNTEPFADTEGSGTEGTEGGAILQPEQKVEDPMVAILKMYNDLVAISEQIEDRREKLTTDIAKLEALSSTVENSDEKHTAMVDQLKKVEDAKEVMKYLEENKEHIAKTLEKVADMEKILTDSSQKQAEVGIKLEELKKLSASITTQQNALSSSEVTNLKIGSKLTVGSATMESSGKITGTELNVPTMGKFTSLVSNHADAAGTEFRHSNKTQGIGLGYNTLYATGSNPNQRLGLKSRGAGQIEMDSPTLFKEQTTFKSGHSKNKTHFPYTDGKNYISGETIFRNGSLNFNDETYFNKFTAFNDTTQFNSAKGKEKTHFPWKDGKNYITGENTFRQGLSNFTDKVNLGGDVNLEKRMYFGDSTMSSGANMKNNNSDPYYLEKVTGKNNVSQLRLTLKDDADESFRIANNDNADDFKHIFRADGQAEHRGSLKVMKELCIDDVCITADQLKSLNQANGNTDTISVFKGVVKCAQGNYIKTIRQEADYIVHFEYKQIYNSSTDASILQFTKTGKDYPGNSMPGFLSTAGKIKVCVNAEANKTTTVCIETPVALASNKWFSVAVSVVGDKCELYIKERGVDNYYKLLGRQTIKTTRPTGDVEVYVGEGSMRSAHGFVSDLTVYHGNSIQPMYKILYNALKNNPGITFRQNGIQFKGNTEFQLVQNTKIGSFHQTPNYVFAFDIKPLSVLSGWRNIIHCTTGANNGPQGSRQPAIWFYSGTTRLHIRSGNNAHPNSGGDPPATDQLPLNVWTRVYIAVVGPKFRVFYERYGLIHKVVDIAHSTRPAIAKQVNVYASDQWYNAANAKVKNIICYQHKGSPEEVNGHLFWHHIKPGLWLKLYNKAGKQNPSDYNVTKTTAIWKQYAYNNKIGHNPVSNQLFKPYANLTNRHYFTAVFTGYLIPKKTALTTFSVGSDDGSRLYIDDVKVIEQWRLQGLTYKNSSPIQLTIGKPIKIKLEYFERSGGHNLYLKWKGQGANAATFDVIPKTAMKHNAVAKIS